MISSQYEEY